MSRDVVSVVSYDSLSYNNYRFSSPRSSEGVFGQNVHCILDMLKTDLHCTSNSFRSKIKYYFAMS